MKYHIDYIEFWATGHCNLNCKGCSSCSPLSEEWFLDSSSIHKDLLKLKELSITIHNITILGGEPLLHPKLNEIMDAVKDVYPDSRLGVITNGLLLLKMSPQFWDICVKYNVKFNVTCFPVMSDKMMHGIEEKLKECHLEYRLTRKKQFNKILTTDHTEDIHKISKACGCNKAYNLKNGKISRCTVPMAMPILNKRFNAGMIELGIFDIYSAKDGAEIIDFLNQLNDSCKNCSAHPIKVKWEKVVKEPELSDWII